MSVQCQVWGLVLKIYGAGVDVGFCYNGAIHRLSQALSSPICLLPHQLMRLFPHDIVFLGRFQSPER